MPQAILPKPALFIPFRNLPEFYTFPEKFASPFLNKPHPLSLLAATELQHYLHRNQQQWAHNFGLAAGKEGKIIGKMFGVLVVQNKQREPGYLAAFSGKLGGSFHQAPFVPPVFDALQKGSFLNIGMQELTRLNKRVKLLQTQGSGESKAELAQLLLARKVSSVALQARLFDQFFFLNQAGEEKSLRHLFQKETHNNPPAGAGECAAPKLLQYAFQNELQPLALAEFWWGLSPKSANWKHGHFYPACREKCLPILAHMLTGMAVDAAPVLS